MKLKKLAIVALALLGMAITAQAAPDELADCPAAEDLMQAGVFGLYGYNDEGVKFATRFFACKECSADKFIQLKPQSLDEEASYYDEKSGRLWCMYNVTIVYDEVEDDDNLFVLHN